MRAGLRLDAREPFFELDAFPTPDLEVPFGEEGCPAEAAQRWIDEFLERPLRRHPVRFALVNVGERESLYVVKASHLVMDGVAMSYHAELIAEAYRLIKRGEVPDWGAPCVPEALYLDDQKHLASARQAQDLEWWGTHLERVPERRVFRALPGRPDVLGESRHRKYHLSAEVTRKIRAFLEAHRIGPATFFTAMHALVVGFMCNERKVVVQTPVSFGERKTYSRRQGSQIALPPMVLDVGACRLFTEIADEVGVQSRNFFRHIRTPYQIAMRRLGDRKFATVGDLFVNFVPHTPFGNEDFPVSSFEQMHSTREEVLFGVMVMEDQNPDRFSLAVRSSCNHLTEADVERYVKRMGSLASQLVESVELSKLNYLIEEEALELERWQSGVRKPYPRKTLPACFDEVAARHANRPAARDETGWVWTYAELQRRSFSYAGWLAGQGVKKGDVVGVLATRGLRLLEALLGIMRLGAVYLPLDPKSPAERMEHIVRDAKAVLTLDPDKVDAGTAPAGAHALDSPGLEEGAYLIYTSGSTGRPKGVLVPHAGFVNMIQGQIDVFEITPGDHVLQFASPAFDASLSEIFMALLAGACVYPVSDRYRNEPWTLKEYMREHRVTVVTFPPSYLHLFDKEPFPGLRVLITAGEAPITDDALHYAKELAYFNAYGPTEACVCSSMKRVLPDEKPPLSAGTVIPNGSAYILDAQGRFLPAGMTGELHIGGASLACGYYRNEALTATRFRTLPSGERIYATGDLALWSATGEILLQGRTDDQVKIRGNRVEPGEVSFLLERCDGVTQAFVLVTEDPVGKPLLAAFLVLRDGRKLDAVIEWSLGNLPAYMIPSFWHPLDAMPVTITGKVDREALRRLVKQHAATAPGGASAADPELVRLIEAALGRKYDPAADFFAQGGDSLRAMALLHDLSAKYGVEVPFRRFAQCGNLRDIEMLLRQETPKHEERALASVPLGRNQFQLWAYQQANEGTIDYNMPCLLEVAGERAGHFVEGLCRAVKDQPLLSCIVAGEIDAPCFKPRDGAEVPIPIEAFPSAESAAAHFDRLIHTPFNLKTEPPIRLAGARFGTRLQVLVLLHHIAGDAETLAILFRNALRYVHGEQGVKPSLSTQAAFCRRESDYIRSGDFRADKAYWETTLAAPPPFLHRSQKRKGAMALAPLEPALVSALEALAREAGTTVVACFAALLGAFLRRRHDREELLIGIPVGLRETQEEFETAGFFVNTIALRLRGGAEEPAAALVREAGLQFREALAHARYSGDRAAADVLATHSQLGSIEEDGLTVRTVETPLKAGKLSASFTLETGATPRLVLEHDAHFIPEGGVVLDELKTFLAQACGRVRERSRTRVLAEAWLQVLRSEPVAGSDFFKAGGDSIKAIQITGALHRNGVRTLGAADFLRTPSFAELCERLEAETPEAVPAPTAYAPPAPGRRIPLLPLQSELLARHPAHWKSFHMLLPLELDPELPREMIETWLRGLPARHEALRLCFDEHGAKVLAEPQVLTLKRGFFDSGASEAAVIRSAFKLIVDTLDPSAGRTLGAALAEQGERRILVLAGHHLVLDALSFDILREDLLRFCETGEAPAEAPGLATCALDLQKRTEAGTFPTDEQRRFWESVCRAPAGRLHVLKPGKRDVASERVFEERCLEGFDDAGHVSSADVLSALSRALHACGQRDPVFVTLESHGRDASLAAFDAGRSLGWFTSVCPMPLAPAESLERARAEVQPWLRDHFGPLNGHAYGCLKSEAPGAFACDSQIGFNFFGGSIAADEDGATPLPAAAMPGAVPELLHPGFEPDSPLDLIVFFDASGVLHAGAYFSPKVLPADWVSRLMSDWLAALKTLPAYNPPLPEEFRTEIAAISGCAPEEIESIRRPDAGHEMMLYQHLSAEDATYTQQIEFHFEGELDEFALMKAWAEVAARHESLRSLFPMRHPGEFFRLVLRAPRTSSEYHDLSRLPREIAAREQNALLEAERRRGFDLNRGPLLRAQFHRLGSRQLTVSWCFHHLLMDGWCIGILLRELFAIYRPCVGGKDAAPARLPSPMPLAEYAAWRARLDEGAAKQYWQQLLQELPPKATIASNATAAAKCDPVTLEWVVEDALASKLKALAGANAVTLPILVQSLWAVLLGAENGARRDVVFGLVTNGRPAEVPGIEHAVGLFIQTVPVRVRWRADEPLSRLLSDLKEQSLGQMRHGFLPLPAVGRDLFDHLLVFENYPFETLFEGGALELKRVNGFEKIPYPLGISVVPGERLLFRFLYDPGRLERGRVEALGRRLLALLDAVAASSSAILCRELEAAVTGDAAPATHGESLERVHSEGSPPAGPVAQRSDALAPAAADGELEAALLSLFEAVLDCRVPSVDADFFQLGGHSLLAMRLIAQISKRFSVRLAIEDVMHHRSVRRLARLISGATAVNECLTSQPPKESYPLTSAQMRLWFLQRLHGDSRVNLIPFAARIPGPVERDALQKSLSLLEARHEALRLRVSATSPEQRLSTPGQLRLEYFETPFPASEVVREGMEFGFEKPLIRVALFREPDAGHVLFLCAHHIVFDGWSAELFVRELNQAYAAVLAGRAPDWAPLELGYAQYAVWAATQPNPGLEAVRKMLLPLPERLSLPLDFPRPSLQSFEGRVHAFRLTASQGAGLKRRASELGTTLFPVLLALCNALISRHAGQNELIVGCPAANREQEQTQAMMGLFVNTLAVRTTLKPDQPFAVLVRDVQAAFETALSNQSCPFDKVIDSLQLDRTPSRNPLFDVFVALEGAEWSHFGRPPLALQPLALPHDRSKFDLSFYFKESETGGFDVHLEYCTALFKHESIERLGGRLVCLVDEVLRRTDAPLSALQIIPEAERRQLAAFNDTAESFDIEHDADHCFRTQLKKSPGAPAILEASGASCSYAEFDRHVSNLTGWLLANGVAPGAFVGVCFERSLELMMALFAVLRAGATYVPLSSSLPSARLEAMFEDLGQCPVLCAREFAGRFEALGRPVLAPEIPQLPTATVRPVPVRPESVAYTIFTSGSTGRSKGALVEHRSLLNRLLWMQSRFPIGEGDVVLQKTTISFDVSVWELVWWSWTGAALAMLEPGAEKAPGRIVDAIQAHKVTVMHFVPSMLRAFLDHLEAVPADRAKLASLRYVFASGEALTRDLVLRFQAFVGAQLHNLYGPTEAAIDVTWYPCLDAPGDVIPIGRPVSNTQMHVLDEQLRPVPIGVAGELYIGGVQVARGYLNRKELTEQRFLPDPFIPGGRLYRTGDLGRWLPDGNIEYLGRNDDQVKVRGFRIELGEVESALNRCPGVSQAVVRVRKVGGFDSLEAFLLPHEGATLSAADIHRELAALLPEYMHPGLLHVVDEIPLSSSGKADRRQLKGRPLLAPAASESRPLDAREEEVRRVWLEVIPELEAADANLGFFEAGGNSLLLTRLHTLLDAKWPGVFTVAALFAESTIAAQAALLEKSGASRHRSQGTTPRDTPIAIIGMAVRLGDYEDLASFWADLSAGVDRKAQLPAKRREETRQLFEAVGLEFDESRLGEASYLSEVSSFDHRRFGLSPADASLIEPQQRLFFETCLRALDDAGYGGAALQDGKVGVFVGASPARLFQDAVTRAFPEQAEQVYLLNVPSNVVARISYLKNWTGPAATIDTACSSSLTALHEACESLKSGACSVAIVGAANLISLPVKAKRAFSIESSTGQTRTFDAKADGVGGGEGAAVFVLKRLDEAQNDGDAIRAVILGTAINQDGKASSMAAPNPAAQAEVISLAAARAGVPLESVDCFEAHGTATVLGDPVEIEGLARAFAANPSGGPAREKKALIGSIKGNIGHLDAAAGALGLAKAVMTLTHGFVPPQPHFETPNPHINFAAAPVRVARELEPLPAGRRPWLCGVSSFGLSGVNAHVILSEAPRAELPVDRPGWYCVPLSAGDEPGLRRYAAQLLDAVRQNEHWPVHAIAGTLVAGREHLEVRVAFVVSSRAELLEQLAAELHPAKVPKPLSTPGTAGVFSSREAALSSAAAFLDGQRPVWPEDTPLRRLHLPATPLLRKPSWPRFKTCFLSKPLPTPDGKVFSLALGRPDFWPVAEHRLGNVPTLVGMAAPDLFAAAAASPILSIEGLSWHRPVTFAGGSQASLIIRGRGETLSAELHHAEGETWTLAVSAKLHFGQEADRRELDLEAIRRALKPFELVGGESVVRVSERWNCRRALWVSETEDRLLVHLVLPDAFKADLNTFNWHPALLDLAASLALHKSVGFVPARCARIRLLKPLPAEVYASVTVTERKPELITADCVVTDNGGRVLVEMNGLVFLSLQSGSSKPKPKRQAEPVLHALEWTRTELPPAGVPGERKLCLLGNESHVLQAELSGLAAFRRVVPADLAGRTALARELIESGVTHLVCLSSPDWPHGSLAGLLQELCRARLRAPLHVAVIGSGAFANPGPDPQDALSLGLLLSLPQEEPLLSCAYVELESKTAAAVATLRAGLGRFSGACLVGADGAMRSQALAPLSVMPRAMSDFEGCVVISGGLGGMGLTLARQFSDHTRAKVVLLHRKAAGAGDVPFAAYGCDINDAARVREVFAEIRREHGPIKGIVHTAGLAGGGFLAIKDHDAYERVLRPKVEGTRNLHEASLEDPLDFFVLASSRTALTGAPGQCDYAAANAYLNAFARYRRSQGLPALSICWNAWSEVGMAARFGTDNAGFALAPDQAWDVLCRALAFDGTQVAVAMSGEDLFRFRPMKPLQPAPVAGAEGRASGHLPRFSEAEALEVIGSALGYEETLTRDHDFYQLGGDSISATLVVSRVNEKFGVKVGVIDLLDCSSLGEFVDRVRAELGARGQPVAAAIVPAPERERYPVGREQLSILYAGLLSGSHTGFNLPLFLRLPRDLDRKRLERAIGALIERHEVLRTTFCDFDQERPNMVVHPFKGFELRELRLDSLDAKDALITPFDVKAGDLFRAKLLVIGETERVLFLDIHHALADGRTISLLNADLHALYYRRPLAPVGLQQKDIAWHQFTHPNAGDKAYWTALFPGELPKLDLPSSLKRPPTHTNRGSTYEFELPAELVAGVQTLARGSGVTHYVVALTAWRLLIHRYTGLEDFVIAVTADIRGEHLGTAGMLAALLPLRMRETGGKTTGELLREVQQASNDARRHKDYILNDLLTDMHPPLALERTLLSEVILSYMNFEFADAQDALFETLPFANPASKADLSIFASDAGGKIAYFLEYYADLFTPEDIRTMAADFITILRLMVSGGAGSIIEFEPEPARRSGCVERHVDGELAGALERFCGRNGHSPGTVLLATFAALLSRVTARNDISVDCGAGGSVSFAIDEDTEFEELLAAARSPAAARPQGVAPGENGPLTAGFAYSENGSDAREGGDEVDLLCSAWRKPDRLTLRFSFDSAVVQPATAANWLSYFEQFLAEVTKEPSS